VSVAAATAAADAAAVAARLAGVKAVLLVLSGKGGVGKSTLASQLALAFAATGKAAGLVDLDVCGPSVPRMAGVGGRDVHASGSGWAPVYVDDEAFSTLSTPAEQGAEEAGSCAVMSIGFLLPDPDGAVVWRGPRKHGLITKFLRDVDWGDLDVLVVDTPPGTSDEHMSAAALLLGGGGGGGGSGGGGGNGGGGAPNGASSTAGPRVAALIVTTPQEVALADVRKEVSFCKKVRVWGVSFLCVFWGRLEGERQKGWMNGWREKTLTRTHDHAHLTQNTQVGLPILGVVENMAALALPAAALSFTDPGAVEQGGGGSGGGAAPAPATDVTAAVAAAVDASLGPGAWARLAATAPVFHAEGGDEAGGAALARRAGAPFLGRVPLDPALGRAGEEGRSVLASADGGGRGPAAVAMRQVVQAVLKELGV
jgi:Mrp family chromosome partitioning ATPase